MTGIHDIRQLLRLQTIKPAEEKSSRGILGEENTPERYRKGTRKARSTQCFLAHLNDFWNNAAP